MKTTLAIFGISVALLAGCNTTSSDKNGENQVDSTDNVSVDTINVKVKYPMPTSFEITEMVNKTGTAYISGITNPVENVEKYFTVKSKALNLGIYGADLAYASTYQKRQETMQYLDASRKLIDQLEITTAFNEALAEKVEKNIENKDSLIQVITKSYYDTYDFLTQNGRDNISLLVIAGSWFEGIFITTQAATLSGNNMELITIILNQKNSLNDLINLLGPSSSDPAIADVLTDLNNLKVSFDALKEPLSKDQLAQLAKKIETLRNKVIHS